MSKMQIVFTPYRVQYGANGPKADAVRLSAESGSHYYAVSLTADGNKYFSVDAKPVPALPKTPYCAALDKAYREIVFLLSRYLHAGETERRALFWEIKEAIK